MHDQKKSDRNSLQKRNEEQKKIRPFLFYNFIKRACAFCYRRGERKMKKKRILLPQFSNTSLSPRKSHLTSLPIVFNKILNFFLYMSCRKILNYKIVVVVGLLHIEKKPFIVKYLFDSTSQSICTFSIIYVTFHMNKEQKF